MRVDLRAWRTWLEPVVDVGVAAAVLLLSLLPLLSADGCGCVVPGWAWAVVVAQAVPLVWRRRWPFAVALVCGVFSMVYGVAALPDPPVAYAALVGLYSAAAYATRRLAYAAGLFAALGIAVALVLDAANADLQDVAVNYLVFATAWLLGDNTRTRRERAARLEDQVLQAERDRDLEARRAVVEERNRIAREMHDVVAHHVSLMVVQAEAGPLVVERDPATAVQAFDAIGATGKQALTEMRQLLGVLRDDEPAGRMPQPGADQLPHLVDQVRAGGLPVDLDVGGDVRPLPPAVDLSLYRLVQEALTNVSRHAGEARAHVQVRYSQDEVLVSVVDDGVGGRQPTRSGGHGLVAMRERVTLVGGTLSVGAVPAGGWSVTASLPLTAAPT
ncbi:MAG TPA: sensor histidine kinase [Nocardioidaceae bacterium]|nr:sensor histidine kinase [Nocardioidaceae bacterium]